jgi:enterochelin esterase family protein
VRENYRVSLKPEHVTIGGMSAGGRMAAYCGLRHSEVFGNVLSLSGGFEWWPGALEERIDEEPGWLTRQFVTAPRLPVHFYLAAGRFEHWFFPSSLLLVWSVMSRCLGSHRCYAVAGKERTSFGTVSGCF